MSGKTLTYGYRLDQLKNLRRMLSECVHEFEEALYKDLRRPKMEGRQVFLTFKSTMGWNMKYKLTCIAICNLDYRNYRACKAVSFFHPRIQNSL
jgi:hypothetical protein